MRSGRAAAAAAMLLATVACRDQQPYEKPLTPVRVAAVRPSSPGGVTRYSATVDPATRVDVAFRVGGYVRAIGTVAEGGGRRPLREGDHVARGAVLATVDQADYTARVQQARAQVEEATVAAAQADRSFARAKALYEAEALARPDFESAQTAQQAASARAAAATAALRQVESALGDSTLVAPFDGVILKKLVNVGALAAPGTPAFVLADTTTVKAVFGAPDVALATLRDADPEVHADAFPGVLFPGRITNISPSADPRGRVFDVELTIPNADGRLRPGMIASVEVRQAAAGDEAPSLVVPLAAITRPPKVADAYAVYIVEAQGEEAVARLRPVGLGEMRGNQVTVTSGLRPGDRVVVSGATLVTDGERVRIVL